MTHLNAAPTVLISLANHPAARPFGRTFTVTTAGAPPSPTIIGQMTALGADVVHVYGLTETYGPYTVCEVQDDWAGDQDQAVRLMARQGVAYLGADPIRVVDEAMNDVPRDGATMGEVVMRGNNVMAGYYNDPEATARAFRGGWFHSGDLAVWHPDGYIELRDRAKDIIISGGENISTIEDRAGRSQSSGGPRVRGGGDAPRALGREAQGLRGPQARHVGGTRPRSSSTSGPASPGSRLPMSSTSSKRFPKTSTGKIQKYVLREQVWAGPRSGSTRIN